MHMKRYVLKLANTTLQYVISELLFAGSISRHYVKKIYSNDGGGSGGEDGDDENDNNKVLMMIIMVVIVMLT